MNSMSDLFREEPIPFVIYNNDLRSKWLAPYFLHSIFSSQMNIHYNIVL